MTRVVSIHEYALKPEVDEQQFEQAIREARQRGLLQLPGLQQHHFLRGIRGAQRGGYAAIWVYDSRESWETLWGPVSHPHAKRDYPENWKIWEDEVLAPFLGDDPNKIRFSAYEEF